MRASSAEVVIACTPISSVGVTFIVVRSERGSTRFRGAHSSRPKQARGDSPSGRVRLARGPVWVARVMVACPPKGRAGQRRGLERRVRREAPARPTWGRCCRPRTISGPTRSLRRSRTQCLRASVAGVDVDQPAHHADLPLVVVPDGAGALDGPMLIAYDGSHPAAGDRGRGPSLRPRALVVHVGSPSTVTARGEALASAGGDLAASSGTRQGARRRCRGDDRGGSGAGARGGPGRDG